MINGKSDLPFAQSENLRLILDFSPTSHLGANPITFQIYLASGSLLPTSIVVTLVQAIFILYLEYFFLLPPLLAYGLFSSTRVTYKQKQITLYFSPNSSLVPHFLHSKNQSYSIGLQGLTQSVPHTAFLSDFIFYYFFATLTLFSQTQKTLSASEPLH